MKTETGKQKYLKIKEWLEVLFALTIVRIENYELFSVVNV